MILIPIFRPFDINKCLKKSFVEGCREKRKSCAGVGMALLARATSWEFGLFFS